MSEAKKELSGILAAGAVVMALAITMGAFGAHALQSVLSEKALNTYKTGQEYLIISGFSLLALGFMDSFRPDNRFKTLAWTMGAGACIFTGTLMMISLAGIRWAGAITPIGGALLIGSWLATAFVVLKPRS